MLARNRLRTGGGGGVPGARGSKLPSVELGRGGSDTGRGGCATGLGATAAGAGSLTVGARFSLSLAVPRSSPMEALCVGRLSIAQIAVELLRSGPRGACRGVNAS
jgi:hypothetical protein